MRIKGATTELPPAFGIDSNYTIKYDPINHFTNSNNLDNDGFLSTRMVYCAYNRTDISQWDGPRVGNGLIEHQIVGIIVSREHDAWRVIAIQENQREVVQPQVIVAVHHRALRVHLTVVRRAGDVPTSGQLQ